MTGPTCGGCLYYVVKCSTTCYPRGDDYHYCYADPAPVLRQKGDFSTEFNGQRMPTRCSRYRAQKEAGE